MMNVIEGVSWQGDLDGAVILRRRESGPGKQLEEVIDRLGDLLVIITDGRFRDPAAVGVAGAFGVCLSTRRVTQRVLVPQIIDRAIQHISGSNPVSAPLYQTMERMRSILVSSPEENGEALRRKVLDEARAIEAEAFAAGEG